ncbi:hypothetical protein [Anaerotardibacter muris]|uniref:hypothetical protein n=1 Tax=Anaerotardibacter muris TaxID=2941505 RepID=UPI002041C4D9|nr:hypothetical protein [Anaerotardibacter muris]
MKSSHERFSYAQDPFVMLHPRCDERRLDECLQGGLKHCLIDQHAMPEPYAQSLPEMRYEPDSILAAFPCDRDRRGR